MGLGLSKNSEENRSFSIINVGKHGSCKTKGKGVFINKTPSGAAKEAFSEFCRTKRIRGVCSLIVTLQENTNENDGKIFSYKLKRIKLKKPFIRLEGTNNEDVIEYKTHIRALKVPVECEKPGQTRGRPLKRTARKNVLNIEQLKKMRKKSRKVKK